MIVRVEAETENGMAARPRTHEAAVAEHAATELREAHVHEREAESQLQIVRDASCVLQAELRLHEGSAAAVPAERERLDVLKRAADLQALTLQREAGMLEHKVTFQKAEAVAQELCSEVAAQQEELARCCARRACAVFLVRGQLAVERGAASMARAAAKAAADNEQEVLRQSWAAEQRLSIEAAVSAMASSGVPVQRGSWSRGRKWESNQAANLCAEAAAWERKYNGCQKQLEWMQRDAAQKKAQVAALRTDVRWMTGEQETSHAVVAALEEELRQVRQGSRQYKFSIGRHFASVMASCRERVLASLVASRHSSMEDGTSEIEDLFGDTCDWSIASDVAVETGSEPGQQVTEESELFSSFANLCDSLESAARDAFEASRPLSDALLAFNAATDATVDAASWWADPAQSDGDAVPVHRMDV